MLPLTFKLLIQKKLFHSHRAAMRRKKKKKTLFNITELMTTPDSIFLIQPLFIYFLYAYI